MTRTETGGSRLILSSSMIIIPWVGCKGKKEKLLHGRKKKASRKAVFIVKWPYRVSQTTGRGEDKARGGLAGIIFSHLSTKELQPRTQRGPAQLESKVTAWVKGHPWVKGYPHSCLAPASPDSGGNGPSPYGNDIPVKKVTCKWPQQLTGVSLLWSH